MRGFFALSDFLLCLGYQGDGGPGLSASLYLPSCIYGTPDDSDIYIADKGNGVVRKYNVLQDHITTYVGQHASPGYADGALTSAQLKAPFGVFVDTNANLYISDQTSNTIRFVEVSHSLVATVAGVDALPAGFSGDHGPATSAQFDAPSGVYVDEEGVMFVADLNNRRVRATFILPPPVVVPPPDYFILTFAGTGSPSIDHDEDGTPAAEFTLNDVTYLWGDSLGSLYMSDRDFHIVRKVDALLGNIVVTVVGVKFNVGSTLTGDPLTSELNTPSGLWGNMFGNLYICDSMNNRVLLMIEEATIELFVDGLMYPVAVWGDLQGNVYVLEGNNHALQVIYYDDLTNKHRLAGNPGDVGQLHMYVYVHFSIW